MNLNATTNISECCTKMPRKEKKRKQYFPLIAWTFFLTCWILLRQQALRFVDNSDIVQKAKINILPNDIYLQGIKRLLRNCYFNNCHNERNLLKKYDDSFKLSF